MATRVNGAHLVGIADNLNRTITDRVASVGASTSAGKDTVTGLDDNSILAGGIINDRLIGNLGNDNAANLALSRGTTNSQPVLTQSNLLKTLTVTGQGEETIPTTLAEVRLGVEVQGKTAAEVQQEVAQRSSAVVAFLKSRKVDKLETTSISLQPTYSFKNDVQHLTGFSGSNIVSFRVAQQRTGPLLDEAVKAGATRIDDISLIASDSAIAAAQQRAQREAAQDGLAQAANLFRELNLTPQEVVSIQSGGATPPQLPVVGTQRTTNTFAESSDVITPVLGGEQQVDAFVTLQISY